MLILSRFWSLLRYMGNSFLFFALSDSFFSYHIFFFPDQNTIHLIRSLSTSWSFSSNSFSTMIFFFKNMIIISLSDSRSIFLIKIKSFPFNWLGLWIPTSNMLVIITPTKDTCHCLTLISYLRINCLFLLSGGWSCFSLENSLLCWLFIFTPS